MGSALISLKFSLSVLEQYLLNTSTPGALDKVTGPVFTQHLPGNFNNDIVCFNTGFIFVA